MAVYTLMLLNTYLRPSQLLSCLGKSLLPPTLGASRHWTLLVHPEDQLGRSKTGEADVSFLLDCKYLQWMPPIYIVLAQRSKDLPLFNFNYPEFCAEMKVISSIVQFPLVPYQLRHSGASIDRADNNRALTDVQARGQWKALRSCLRYDKHARLAETFQRHTDAIKTHARDCEQHLEAIVLTGKRVVLPADMAKRLASAAKGSTSLTSTPKGTM